MHLTVVGVGMHRVGFGVPIIATVREDVLHSRPLFSKFHENMKYERICSGTLAGTFH